jgi:hypothetical protein
MVEALSRYGLAMECINSGDPAAAQQHFGRLLSSNASFVPRVGNPSPVFSA